MFYLFFSFLILNFEKNSKISIFKHIFGKMWSFLCSTVNPCMQLTWCFTAIRKLLIAVKYHVNYVQYWARVYGRTQNRKRPKKNILVLKIWAFCVKGILCNITLNFLDFCAKSFLLKQKVFVKRGWYFVFSWFLVFGEKKPPNLRV